MKCTCLPRAGGGGGGGGGGAPPPCAKLFHRGARPLPDASDHCTNCPFAGPRSAFPAGGQDHAAPKACGADEKKKKASESQKGPILRASPPLRAGAVCHPNGPGVIELFCGGPSIGVREIDPILETRADGEGAASRRSWSGLRSRGERGSVQELHCEVRRGS